MLSLIKKAANSIYLSIMSNKILNIFIIFYCSFMIYAPPYFVNFVPSSIKTPLRLLGMVFILLFFIIFTIHRARIEYLFIPVFLLCTYLVLLTVYKKTYFNVAIYSNFIMTLSGLSLFSIYMDSDYKKEFVIMNYSIWLISILIFFIVLLFDYTAFTTMYNRNTYIMFYLTFFLFQEKLNILIENKKIKYLSMIMVFITLLITTLSHAATSMICVIFYILYKSLIQYNKNLSKLFKIFESPYIYILLLSLVFFLIIFPGTNSELSNIISRIMGKTEGLSLRSPIYDSDKIAIANNWLFGYGCQDTPGYQSIVNWYDPHNFIFQYLIDGGVIALSLMLISFYFIHKNISLNSKYPIKSFLYFMFFVFLLRNMFEAIGLNYLYFYLANIYYFIEPNSQYLELNFLKI